MVSWNGLIQAAGFGSNGPPLCAKGKRRTQWGVGVQTIDPATYGTLAQQFDAMIAQYPASSGSAVDMQLLPTQGVKAVPLNSTSYPWRNLVSHK